MKKVLIGFFTLVSLSAFAEECSRIVKLKQMSSGSLYVEATLENGLVGTAINEQQKFYYQTAYISNTKLCYEMVIYGTKIAGHLSVQRF